MVRENISTTLFIILPITDNLEPWLRINLRQRIKTKKLTLFYQISLRFKLESFVVENIYNLLWCIVRELNCVNCCKIPRGGGGGDNQKLFIRGVWAICLNIYFFCFILSFFLLLHLAVRISLPFYILYGKALYPVIYHFSRKREPCRICIPSFGKWYPFHIPCLELCIPLNCCKFTIF